MSFKDYVYSNRKTVILFLLIITVFAVAFPLYQLPIDIIIYPVVIGLFFLIIFLLIDYRKQMKHYQELEHCRESLDEVMECMPGAKNIIEEEYQQLILILRERLGDRELVSKEKYSQMIEYYSIWVHQIKTPIASMRLMLEEQDSAESRRLSSELNRIEQYVSMVMTYLRLDSDSSDFVIKEYSLDELLRPSIKKFARDFIGKKLSLEYESIDQSIITDKKWFAFVVEQILSNALKYTSKGGIRIYVENDFLVIKDTGMGIAPEDLPRIFEQGYTGYNGRNDEKASGIGLYLCKRICDELGIAIKVESVVAEGTAVYLGLSQSNVNFHD